ncbi:hypothetical protein GCM10011583_72690 [Streptomyces camponoticapitis]|uniref:Uncharacterized protein n=1 Tax=Streptomyces camponoticapitis TaxID=1616125 RepID=A0ABQ2EZV1_9ACTN|nr:hypothetical protein GCM10011583_72690 [Streptomyces camponoticapitis]
MNFTPCQAAAFKEYGSKLGTLMTKAQPRQLKRTPDSSSTDRPNEAPATASSVPTMPLSHTGAPCPEEPGQAWTSSTARSCRAACCYLSRTSTGPRIRNCLSKQQTNAAA